MKPGERDELLGRLDERSANTYSLVEKQEKHLAKLNDKVGKNTLNIDRNHNRLTDVEKVLTDGVSLKFTKKQVIGASSGGVAVIVGILAAVCKLLGI